MRKSIFQLILIAWLPTAICNAELVIKIGEPITKGGGNSKLENDNAKGQTFKLPAKSEIKGLKLGYKQIDTSGDLTVSIYPKVNNQPSEEPVFTDSGTLPGKGSKAGLLVIDFSSPIELEAGDYALVFSTKNAKLLLALEQASIPSGSLIRKNSSTQQTWKPGNGKSSDLAIELVGAQISTETKPTTRTAKISPVKLTTHNNPEYTPKKWDSIPKQPNLIVCMVDDLGWNQIGVGQATMGTAQKKFKTPTLDRMAKQGLSFTHAYAQPNCAPTRAAMLSGQYPARIHNDVYVVGSLSRHGRGGISAKDARFSAPKQTEDVATEAITVAEALKENGYATAHIGKYHVGGHDGDKTLPENVGFDINIGGFKQGHQPVCFAKQNGEKWQFKGLGRGDFDRFGKPYTEAYVNKYGFPTSLVGTAKHVSDALADAMEETVGKLAAADKPFYLQVHPYAVHGPVQSRPDLKAAAGDDNLAGFVRSIDLILDRMLKLLNDPNWDGDQSDSIAEHTLILFTSDNGGTHGNNLPLRGHKGMFTEGGMRVPLIAYWPGVIPANTVTDVAVHTVDYYPTLIQFAGNKYQPDQKTHPLDGFSFADVLLDPATAGHRQPIYYLFPGYMDQRAQPSTTVIETVDGTLYKAYFEYESNSWQLYDLQNDISEQTNLVDKQPAIVEKLSNSINTWLAQEHPTWKPKYPISKQSQKPVGPPAIFKP